VKFTQTKQHGNMQFSFAASKQGSIRETGKLPLVLCLTTDQGLFRAYVHLAYTERLRVAWFPDMNHMDANLDKTLLEALNLSHCTEKVQFLSRLNRGPNKAAGRWFGQIRRAFQVCGQRIPSLTDR